MQHDQIGAEHLLLGVVREEGGVAARVLMQLGVELDALRSAVLRQHPPGIRAERSVLPFALPAKQVLENALREALALGHNYIGTEHVLLGLGRVGVAAQAGGRVLDHETVRAAVLRALRGPESEEKTRPPGPPDPPLVPGDMGTPSREQMERMALTFSVFDWLQEAGLLEGELKRLHTAFMWEVGYKGLSRERLLAALERHGPPPSWVQMTDLLRENRRQASRLTQLEEALRFYADEPNWGDAGRRARAALHSEEEDA